jgi:hypothetical protein
MKNILYATLATFAGAAIARALYLALAINATCCLAKARNHEADQLAAYRAQHLASTHNQATAKR